MRKRFVLLLSSVCLGVALVGCSNQKPDASQENTSSVVMQDATNETEQASGDDSGSAKVISYSNRAGTYTVNVDDYVSFVETTTHATSSVNNEDGLELNYHDTYITIQKYPIAPLYEDIKSFYDYLDGDRFSSMVVGEGEVAINNAAVTESIVETIEMKNGDTVFAGYIFYFKTDNGYYKVLISGSETEVIEHYKNFVDNMTFK